MSPIGVSERLACETGATVGGTLYFHELSVPSGPAPIYLAMVRHDARTSLGTPTN